MIAVYGSCRYARRLRIVRGLDHQGIAVAGAYDRQPGTGYKLCPVQSCN